MCIYFIKGVWYLSSAAINKGAKKKKQDNPKNVLNKAINLQWKY